MIFNSPILYLKSCPWILFFFNLNDEIIHLNILYDNINIFQIELDSIYSKYNITN